MAAKYWIKLYHEILQDPKMGRLPDDLWRRVIELFLIAGETDRGGELPDVGDMAWQLRLTTETLEADLTRLESVGILTKTPDGWMVTNFTKRQAPTETIDRVRQFRERKKKQAPAPKKSNEEVTPIENDGYANVTKSYIDTDTDTESTPNGVGDKSPIEVSKPDGPRKKLMGVFNETTGLQMPHRKTDIKFWWSSIGEIYNMVSCDVDVGEYLIKESVERMGQKGLDITNPNSIIGYCRVVLAENKGHKKRIVIS